jgi:hypothetical protein
MRGADYSRISPDRGGSWSSVSRHRVYTQHSLVDTESNALFRYAVMFSFFSIPVYIVVQIVIFRGWDNYCISLSCRDLSDKWFNLRHSVNEIYQIYIVAI